MRRLRHLGADGEGEHARATKSSSKSSYKARRRSDAGEQIPQLDDALAAGETSAEHVDVVADALAGLSPQDRGRLAAHGDDIRAKAGELAEGEFRRWFALLVRRVRQDDAATRLARQKAAPPIVAVEAAGSGISLLPLTSHENFEAEIRARHGRKSAFWAYVNGTRRDRHDDEDDLSP